MEYFQNLLFNGGKLCPRVPKDFTAPYLVVPRVRIPEVKYPYPWKVWKSSNEKPSYTGGLAGILGFFGIASKPALATDQAAL